MEPGIWNLLSLSCPQQPRRAILESGIWNLLCALVNAPRRSELESGNWNLPFWNFGSALASLRFWKLESARVRRR